MEVAHDAEVGCAEDRSVFIFINSDDEIRLFHTGEVLDCSRDTACHIEVRADCLTGLSDLVGVVHDTGIDHCAR